MPKTNIRNWEYPSKEQSFFDSYDVLQIMWRTIDKEFGSLSNYISNNNITYIWEDQSERDSQRGKVGEYGIRTDSGDVYRYNGDTWELQYTLGQLPIKTYSNPTPDDWGLPIGFNWVNEKTGETFTCVSNSFGSVVWNGNLGTTVHSVLARKFFIPPIKGMTFRNSIYEGITDMYGTFFSKKTDYIIEFLINGSSLGEVNISEIERKYITVTDLEISKDSEGKCDKERVKKILYLIYILTNRPTSFIGIVGDIQPRKTFNDIIESEESFQQFLDSLGIDTFSENLKEEIIFDYIRKISSHEELTIDDKLNILECINECIGLDSMDGNIVYIDGNTITADGNETPECA